MLYNINTTLCCIILSKYCITTTFISKKQYLFCKYNIKYCILKIQDKYCINVHNVVVIQNISVLIQHYLVF